VISVLKMGMDIFFKEDIANALAAAEQAAFSVGAYSDDERAVAFLAGWRSALRTLATAFGLSPATLTTDFEPARRIAALPRPRKEGLP